MLDDVFSCVDASSAASSSFGMADLLAIKAKLDAMPPVPDVMLLHAALHGQLQRLPKPEPQDAAMARFTGLPVEFWRDLDELDKLIDTVRARGFKRWAVFGSDGRRLPNRDSEELHPSDQDHPHE